LLRDYPPGILTYPPQKGIFEDDVPNFPRWDMLVAWRVFSAPGNPFNKAEKFKAGFHFLKETWLGSPWICPDLWDYSP